MLLTLRYNGAGYHGFQVQSNAYTVCEAFQDALEKVFSVRYPVKGCSRTDSGVHAHKFCVSVKINSSINETGLVNALNCALPHDIAVISAREVAPDFHARYSCISKTYRYIILNSHIKDPFRPFGVYLYKHKLDEKILDEQAHSFIGKHDFSAFCAVGSSVESTVRTVKSSCVFRDGDDVIFEVCADGFLYNMVRIMAGTLLDISAGKIKQDSIPAIIKSGYRSLAGRTAPACGLYLYDVEYPENI